MTLYSNQAIIKYMHSINRLPARHRTIKIIILTLVASMIATMIILLGVALLMV